MSQSLIREPDGNVVLRSDNVALRFMRKWGGTPLQWWSEPYPLVTNDFPGSGVSAAWEVGQDPTQASANGLLENPICIFGDASTQKYNYYCRESIFDGEGIYQVTGFAPDFWLSAEAADDSIAPNAQGGDTGWRTKYHPGTFGAVLNQWTCPVVFESKPANHSGLFFPGNEMKGGMWNERLRDYGQGNVAFKINISLQHAGSDALAGVFFRKHIPAGPNVNKDTAFGAEGIHLIFNHAGGYALTQRYSGGDIPLYSGTLSKAQKSNLLSGPVGLQVEIRTNNAMPSMLDIYLDDAHVHTYAATTLPLGPNLCLFAQTSSGYIWFGNRRVWDVGVEFVSTYSAHCGAVIRSDITVQRAANVTKDRLYYRGALPGMFLNQTTFQPADRKSQGYRNGAWENIDGQLCKLSDYEHFFVGNLSGTLGAKATVFAVTVDGLPSPEAHMLAQNHSFNDEFIMTFNPLAPNAQQVLSEMRLTIDWEMKQ